MHEDFDYRNGIRRQEPEDHREKSSFVRLLKTKPGFSFTEILNRSIAMLANIRIVMVRPRGSGNIGSMARAMKNFGETELAIVGKARTQSFWAQAMAVHGRDMLSETPTATTPPRRHRRLHACRRHHLPLRALSRP